MTCRMSRIHNDSEYIVEVVVHDGSNFPRKNHRGFVLQAELCGKPRTTTAVFKAPSRASTQLLSPAWHETLRWILSGRQVHRLRSEKAQLRVEVFHTDNPPRELRAMGFIMLDIRSFSSPGDKTDRPGKWFPISNSGERIIPEVFLSCNLFDGKDKDFKLDPATLPKQNRGIHSRQSQKWSSSHPDHVEGDGPSFEPSLAPPSYFEDDFGVQKTLDGTDANSRLANQSQPSKDHKKSVHFDQNHSQSRGISKTIDDEDEFSDNSSKSSDGTEIDRDSQTETEVSTSESEGDDVARTPPKQHGNDRQASSGSSSVSSSPLPETKAHLPKSVESSHAQHHGAQNDIDRVTTMHSVFDSNDLTHSPPEVSSNRQKFHEKVENSTIPRINKKKIEDSRPNPTKLHHYRLTITLQKFSNICLPGGGTYNLYVKYVYPHLGVPGPVLSLPPVSVPSNSRPEAEFLISNGFTKYEFSMEPEVLARLFQEQPICAEVWHKGAMESDEIVGVCQIHLGQLLAAPLLIANTDHGSCPLQALTLVSRVFNTDLSAQEVQRARLVTVLTLQDLGQMPYPFPQESFAPPVGAETDQVDPRQTAEYAMAWELELWKKTEEAKWMEQLKTREEAHIRVLTEEFNKRDADRSAQMKKAKEEYNKLGEQLRNALLEVEARERQIKQDGETLLRGKEQLAKDRAEMEENWRKKAQSSQEEYNRLLNIERQEVILRDGEISRLQERIKDVQAELEAANERTRTAQREFEVYRLQQNKTPEAMLRSEAQKLCSRIEELERQLASSLTSKENYKSQLTRALKEIGMLRRAQQHQIEQRLEEEKKQLEQMKKKFAALEQKSHLQEDSQQLALLRKELDEIKIRPHKYDWQMIGPPRAEISVLASNVESHMNGEDARQPQFRKLDRELQRLNFERDELLASNCYRDDDLTIAALDTRIAEVAGQMRSLYSQNK